MEIVMPWTCGYFTDSWSHYIRIYNTVATNKQDDVPVYSNYLSGYTG